MLKCIKKNILYVSKGTEYNFDVVKKLAGQGLLYIRIRNGFEFALENPSSSDSDLPQVGMASAVESKTEPEVIEDFTVLAAILFGGQTNSVAR